MTINRAVTIAQQKGGVGKTTLTSNVAGLAAAAGYRVCVIDLDQQGNLARDLGYEPDSGDALFESLIGSAQLPIIKNVRENLDAVPGGPAVGDLTATFSSRVSRGKADLADALEQKIAAIADNYDLILIDTGPGDRIIIDAALTLSGAVVIPTRMDEASIDGVTRIAERFVAVRERNPRLRLAGVVLFGISSRTTRLERDVREALQEVLGTAAPVFDTRIRHLDSAAADARRRGLLVHELEVAARKDRADRLKSLKAGETPTPGLYARDAKGLADDFEQLTHELLARIAEIEKEASVTS